MQVDENNINKRIDKYLKKVLVQAPSSLIYKMLRKKDVKVNGKRISKDYILKENDETINVKTNGLFVLTSSLPSNTFLSKYDIFTSNGYMSVNSNYESKINGIFGIGDVINKELRQVITACADGAIVAQYIANKRK